MEILVQAVTIIAMFVLSYLGLLAFGPPRTSLLYSKADKEGWDSQVQGRLGDWLTSTNVIGTLTSFATVFLFFLGNAKVFGWVTLVCCLTIWFGGWATNAITSRILQLDYVSKLLNSEDQTGGIVASIFWRPAIANKRASRLVKWISMLNIAGVVWLEFALLGDFGGQVLGLSGVLGRSLLVAGAAFAVVYFVLKFGVRGFVFADLFQVPIIGAAVLLLVLGAIFAMGDAHLTFEAVVDAATPILGTPQLLLFVVHVAILNIFLVLVTEPHWLRAWIFRGKETSLQKRATAGTAMVWLVLILLGWVASALAGGKVGEEVVVSLLDALGRVSPVFLSAFWLAAIAALFSTADTQLYSLLLVSGFRPKDGLLAPAVLKEARPLLFSLAAATFLGCGYALVRRVGLPFEKLVFLIIPMSLNLLPGLVSLALVGRPATGAMAISTAGFVLAGIAGLLQPADQLGWTMAAALIPALVAAVVALRHFSSRPGGG